MYLIVKLHYCIFYVLITQSLIDSTCVGCHIAPLKCTYTAKVSVFYHSCFVHAMLITYSQELEEVNVSSAGITIISIIVIFNHDYHDMKLLISPSHMFYKLLFRSHNNVSIFGTWPLLGL